MMEVKRGEEGGLGVEREDSRVSAAWGDWRGLVELGLDERLARARSYGAVGVLSAEEA